jgi:vitamin-K-epoxide reductase (warfarin-sensitive)
LWFKRLRAHRSKEHRIQRQRRPGSLRHGQVSLVRGIKTASEKSNAPPGRWVLIHLPIVPCTAVPHPATYGSSGSIRINTMRYAIAILALAGVMVSALALQVHYSTATEPCDINAKWDCGIVNHSPFAVILHVPVAAIGIAGYLTMATLALFKRRRLLVAMALGALAFSLYLTYIEKYVLEVYCIYCVTSLGIVTLIALFSLSWTISCWRNAQAA